MELGVLDGCPTLQQRHLSALELRKDVTAHSPRWHDARLYWPLDRPSAFLCVVPPTVRAINSAKFVLLDIKDDLDGSSRSVWRGPCERGRRHDGEEAGKRNAVT
jgi:hypothetical protein